jgi:Fe2+ or Zn2+ uptake regulation protein
VKAIRQLLRSGRIDSDAVTIYRSIERLQSVGIIRRVDLGGDSAYYELEPTKEHHHISCVSCGKHEDVSGCLLPRDLSRVLRLARGFSSVTGHSLEFRGVCRTCAQANARITR